MSAVLKLVQLDNRRMKSPHEESGLVYLGTARDQMSTIRLDSSSIIITLSAGKDFAVKGWVPTAYSVRPVWPVMRNFRKAR